MSESQFKSRKLKIPLEEVEITAIRAQGAGGQNVNKTSSAVHLRFDIKASSLPDNVKARLLRMKDSRISNEGVVVIKAQQYRTQDKNRADAMYRLQELVVSALVVQKPRVPTKPTKASQQRRMDRKTRHGRTKALRRKPLDD